MIERHPKMNPSNIHEESLSMRYPFGKKTERHSHTAFATACWMFAAAVTPTLVGCGGVKEERIKVSVSNDPLEQPRSLLKRYADGQPLGSEATMFSSMVESVKKTDPKRGDILEAGLKKLQEASGEERASIASELLKQIQPSMTGS